jgi:hypothetical protein
MSERRKVFIDVKNSQLSYYHILSDWCGNNGLFVRSNQEVFFISERVLMKPEFVINETIYIDLVEGRKITEKYKSYCELFSKSYGTIIVIPKEKIEEINSVTKKDFENRFNIKF